MNSVNRVILIITLKISSFSITNYVALLNKRKTTARGVAVDKELQQNFNNLIIPDLSTVFPFPQENVQHPKRPYNRFRQPERPGDKCYLGHHRRQIHLPHWFLYFLEGF